MTEAETNWNRDSIREERRKSILEKNYSPEEMIERMVELETALYPFVYVLGALNQESWRGTHATSHLFPMLTESGKMQNYTDGKIVEIDIPTEESLHEVEAFEEDSIIINDGRKLNDMFEIMATHQQAPGAYIGCGSIVMGDVRHAIDLLYPKKEEVPKSTHNRSTMRSYTVSYLASPSVSRRAVCMDLSWLLNREIESYMIRKDITNLAFKLDFALDLDINKSQDKGHES